MIGPDGLLLVVPHLFAAVPVSVLLVGLQKSKQLNLHVKNTFAGSHTEHCWRCFYNHNAPRSVSNSNEPKLPSPPPNWQKLKKGYTATVLMVPTTHQLFFLLEK
jgi:hypothetical protein